MHRRLLTPVILIIALAVPRPSWAWGELGHRIVGELASAQLGPAARAEVNRLLTGEAEPSLPGVSNWADHVKPGAYRHFVNFPPGKCHYLPQRDCARGDCVVDAINRNFQVLSDRRRSSEERRMALKYLVHLVADVHQPLHAGYSADRGGNAFTVTVAGTPADLHTIWDSLILETHAGNANDYAAHLRARRPLPHASTMNPAQWAEESCRLVQAEGFYPAAAVGRSWLTTVRPIAERRLRLAGSRLAAMLNAALGSP